jgi:hypothetical protein
VRAAFAFISTRDTTHFFHQVRSSPAAIRGGTPSLSMSEAMPIDDRILAAFHAQQISRPGRKPKLSFTQQRETLDRLAAGESQRSIARDFRVSQATIWRFDSGLAEFLRDTNHVLNHAA